MGVSARDGDPQVTAAALQREGWSREALPLGRRRIAAEAVVGAGFLAAAVALAVLGDAERSFDAGPAILLVALFALGIRVSIDVGVSYTSPVQLAFVPMLLLLPTPVVPLLVALAWFLGKLPDVLAGRVHADRLLLVLGNAWFSVGPALVLVLAGAQTPDWADWPWYLLALLAQMALDLGVSVVREWVGEGIAPQVQLRAILLVQAIDAMLSPLGLLAAFASQSWRYAFLLLVPPAGLLVLYAGERLRRLRGALALADAARERQELIASASHEMVTPLAVLIGLNDRMAPDRRFDDERREQVHAAMRRELVQLRQLVRQFVDYTRLKTERGLALGEAPAEVRPVLDDIAFALGVTARVHVRAPDALAVRADPDRLHQMVLSLAIATLRSTAGDAEVTLQAVPDGGRVDITVDGGSANGHPAVGFDEGGAAGIGLHVTRELALAQGGDVRAQGRTSFVLTLPLHDGAG